MQANKFIKGTAIAAAMASMGAIGIAATGHAADAGKIKCEGANKCKGQGSCKSAKNACAGKNGCSGQGWTFESSKDACTKKGGKVAP